MRLGVPLVATNDVLYHAPERRALQDVLTCIREGCTIDEAGRRLEANAERHLKPPAEMARLFRDHPEAVARTLRDRRALPLLARRAALRISRRDRCPTARTPQATARAADLARALPSAIPTACRRKCSEQLDDELALIAELRLRALLPHRARHRPLCAREPRHPLPGPRLGGQLGGLLLASASPRSIPAQRRPAVRALHLDRAQRAARHRRRFRARAARGGDPVHLRQIRPRPRRRSRRRSSATARAARCARSARRSASPHDRRSAALADVVWGWWPRTGVDERRMREAGLDPADRTICSGASTLASELHRLSAPPVAARRRLRHHARPLDELVPIENAAMADRTVIEWDKDDLDALGMLKVDVLALGMLTCLRKALRAARTQHYGASRIWRSPTSRRDDPARLRDDLPRRHDRRLPDREPRADVDAAAAEAATVLRSRHRGRDRAARADPGRHGASLSSAARDGEEPVDYPTPGAAKRCSSARSACRCSRSRRCRSRSSPPASRRRGRPAAPRHGDVQAQPATLEQLRAASSSTAWSSNGYDRGVRRALLQADRGLRRVRLSREPRGVSFALLVYVSCLAQVPPPGGVLRGAAQQPADGLLRAGADRARRARARRRGAAGRRQPQRWDCTLERSARPVLRCVSAFAR